MTTNRLYIFWCTSKQNQLTAAKEDPDLPLLKKISFIRPDRLRETCFDFSRFRNSYLINRCHLQSINQHALRQSHRLSINLRPFGTDPYGIEKIT
jgi:hypothetical protein